MRSRLGDSDDEEMTTSRIVARSKLFVPYVGDEQANVSPTVAARLHFPPSFLHSCPVPTPNDLPPASCIVRDHNSTTILTVSRVDSAIKLSRTAEGNEESLNSDRNDGLKDFSSREWLRRTLWEKVTRLFD